MDPAITTLTRYVTNLTLCALYSGTDSSNVSKIRKDKKGRGGPKKHDNECYMSSLILEQTAIKEKADGEI